MAETSFASKFIKGAGEEDETPWRRAFVFERDGVSHAFSVSVALKNGRYTDGFHGSLGTRIINLDEGGQSERVLMLFSNGGIYIEGQYLKRGIDGARDGKLRFIQEQDSTEIEMIRRHNAAHQNQEDKEPIVSRVVVSPALHTLLEKDRNLSEIARVIKENEQPREHE